jgi:hypothetical protein
MTLVTLALMKKQQETRRVLSQETLNNTEPWLEISPRKYLGRCNRKPVCHTHLHTSTKLLRLNHTNLQFCENSKRLAGLRRYDFVTGSLKQCVLLPLIPRWGVVLVRGPSQYSQILVGRKSQMPWHDIKTWCDAPSVQQEYSEPFAFWTKYIQKTSLH